VLHCRIFHPTNRCISRGSTSRARSPQPWRRSCQAAGAGARINHALNNPPLPSKGPSSASPHAEAPALGTLGLVPGKHPRSARCQGRCPPAWGCPGPPARLRRGAGQRDAAGPSRQPGQTPLAPLTFVVLVFVLHHFPQILPHRLFRARRVPAPRNPLLGLLSLTVIGFDFLSASSAFAAIFAPCYLPFPSPSLSRSLSPSPSPPGPSRAGVTSLSLTTLPSLPDTRSEPAVGCFPLIQLLRK